jgi:hypothetical protein
VARIEAIYKVIKYLVGFDFLIAEAHILSKIFISDSDSDFMGMYIHTYIHI